MKRMTTHSVIACMCITWCAAVPAHAQKRVDLPEIRQTPDGKVIADGKTFESWNKYVKGMQKVRKAIQDEIQKVSVERTQFVQNIIRQTGKLSLSDAMMKSLRNQARTKGFTFPKMKPAQETAVVAGPPKPVTPLAPEIARNIDALLDSLPRVEFRVGSYASGDARFAGLLKEHTQLQVDYFVGDKSIDSEKEAQAIVIRQLNKMAADMQAIREVPVPVASPFPYADRAENRNTVRFQIGGINFSKRSSAEEAHKRILDVVARFKEDHAGGDQKIVLASHNTAGEPTLGVASLREMIRAIATAAGRVWMDKGFGC